VNISKNKKQATAEPGNKRRKRTRLIRLNDLIPEKDVKGGHQVLFGISDTAQTNNPTQKK